MHRIYALFCYAFNNKYLRSKQIRDVTRDYSPALASILVDDNIEVEEDFTAIILYLCSKGYLTMEKAEQENTFFFHIKDDDIS